MSDALLPLTVALPLLAAALLAGVGSHLPRAVVEWGAVAVAAATTVLSVLVLLRTRTHEVVHWFGGWHPHGGHTLGIAFTANTLDAFNACTVGVLAVAGLGFAIHYYEEAGHLFQVLMLAFLGGMTGFSVTGDLFNLFVFFEIMSVAAYALCGYRIERESVLQGALNFAVLNSIGAFFVLMGITLVYARTGTLNLAQIGATLDGQKPDATLAVAFTLLLVGFLVKAGAVPFHFWLSDAYAVAAVPAGALFAGIMSDLGYHAIARVYWQGFSGSFGPFAAHLRTVLLVVAVVTAVVGAVMCFLQADLKRQLAFLVVCHGGVFLAGIALLTPLGLAGSTVYLAADAGFKGALFLALGLTVHKLGSSDEITLKGRGRHRKYAPIGVVLALAALGAAACPGLGTWRTAGMLASAAASAGAGWLPPVLAAATSIATAGLVRGYARVYLGWGGSADAMLRRQADPELGGESEEASWPNPWLLLTAVFLVVASVVTGDLPGLVGRAATAAASFVDLHGYIREVLHGVVPPMPVVHPPNVTGLAWIYGAGTTGGALLLAALALWPQVVPQAVRRILARALPVVHGMHRVHTGAMGDYALWLSGGAAALVVTVTAAVH